MNCLFTIATLGAAVAAINLRTDGDFMGPPSLVMADSLILAETTVGAYDECREKTTEILAAGVVTLKSSKPENKVKLCLASLKPGDSQQNGWRIMSEEMDNDKVFKVVENEFKPNDPDSDSDWGKHIFKLKAKKLDSDDP